jgi:heat shock protein HtpX
MAIAKRIALFLLTNILIMVSISIVWMVVTQVFGIGAIRGADGLQYGPLMIYCLIWGFMGSFISLALSRIMAKWMMGVRVIDPASARGAENALVSKVYALARTAGLQKMPQVGIYESPELNAFATGPTKNRALVAVSSGLLHQMTDEEVEGVLAHEIAHVANGDMVTMTLIQGVVNAFVLFFAKIIAYFVGQSVKEESRPMVEFAVSLVAQIFLGVLGAMVVARFSRWREFRADAGAVKLGGKQKMVSALERLRRNQDLQTMEQSNLAAFKISGSQNRFLQLLSTHPPLEERISRLRSGS